LRNALRYFEPKHHAELLPEFKAELETYGRIYMYRLRPDYKMYARPISEYPGKCEQAKAIMLMIQNNLDYAVAQHPHELITYGGNTHANSILKCKICDTTTSISFHSFSNNLRNYVDSSNSWGCAKCSGKKQKTTSEFASQLDEIYKGNIILNGEYTNVGTHVSLLCTKCNGTWSTTPSTILRGSQCPLCLRIYRDSVELRRIIYILDTLKIEFEREVTFEGLRHKLPLYFDFCISMHNTFFLIEFDGQQHFRGWQGCPKSLATNKIRDEKKNKFCKEYNLPLLRLNYEMSLGEIEEVLCAFIDRYKLL
jgi:hypothetical protein